MPLEDTRQVVKVALDASFAGVNTTGVGLYSARLAATLKAQAAKLKLNIRCYGPTCVEPGSANAIWSTAQEWPINTHLALPLRLLRDKPIIVHSTSHIGPLWGPGKQVVTVHDLIFRRYPQDYSPVWLLITRVTLPAVLRRAAAIIADSQATKCDIERFYRVRPGKIAVVYPGVDDTYVVEQSANSASKSIEGRYILCLGPWVRRKNLEVVVRAFRQLARRITDLRLIITGKPSVGMKGYTEQELVGSLPADIRSRVCLTGYVAREDIPSLVTNASVLAYPSRWEGFGLPPLEAMSAGVPVVASNTPAVAEVTAGAAYLCDPDDANQWTRALERILLDRDYAQRMIEEGRRRSASFTWERCAAQTARVYHQVASTRRHSRVGNRRA